MATEERFNILLSARRNPRDLELMERGFGRNMAMTQNLAEEQAQRLKEEWQQKANLPLQMIGAYRSGADRRFQTGQREKQAQRQDIASEEARARHKQQMEARQFALDEQRRQRDFMTEVDPETGLSRQERAYENKEDLQNQQLQTLMSQQKLANQQMGLQSSEADALKRSRAMQEAQGLLGAVEAGQLDENQAIQQLRASGLSDQDIASARAMVKGNIAQKQRGQQQEDLLMRQQNPVLAQFDQLSDKVASGLTNVERLADQLNQFQLAEQDTYFENISDTAAMRDARRNAAQLFTEFGKPEVAKNIIAKVNYFGRGGLSTDSYIKQELGNLVSDLESNIAVMENQYQRAPNPISAQQLQAAKNRVQMIKNQLGANPNVDAANNAMFLNPQTGQQQPTLNLKPVGYSRIDTNTGRINPNYRPGGARPQPVRQPIPENNPTRYIQSNQG